MEPYGTHSRAEILSQPEVWAATLARLDGHGPALDALARAGYDEAIFTGCGSTYYLSLAAAAALQEAAGLPARAVPAGELWLSPEAAAPPRGRALLVAVSRSGATTETLRACAAFLAAGRGDLLTLSCDGAQPLASMGALNLVFPEAQERSLAQTRAFSSLYLAALFLAARWAGRDDLRAELGALPGAARRLIVAHDGLTRDLGADRAIDRFYFLGSGARHGLACELSLKLKEMALAHCEPFHFLEFRHGPRAMATPGALVVALLSQRARAHEAAVLDELRAQGARVLAIGEADADVAFGAGLSDLAAGPLYLPIGQMLAYERAMSAGLNPDLPANLTHVIRLS
jgi:glucosamine--fructose-6-phosphate aminotransferase (isomerizing)